MASASRASRRPVSLFVSAAAFLIHTTASTNGASGNWWEMGKLRRARPGRPPGGAGRGAGGRPGGGGGGRGGGPKNRGGARGRGAPPAPNGGGRGRGGAGAPARGPRARPPPPPRPPRRGGGPPPPLPPHAVAEGPGFDEPLHG